MVSADAAIAKAAHGPALAGIFMNIMLYGIMISQTFFYFSACKDDARWVKIFVLTLFALDTINSALSMWWIYNALVNNFGNVAALATANWLFIQEAILAGIIPMMVQLFYAWRIRRLTHNNWVVSGVIITSIAGGLGGLGTAIGIAMRPDFADLQQLKVIVIIWLLGAAICDISITLALTLHLHRHRTGYAQTDSVISRIISVTMSNGLLTAGFALADVVAFLATPTGLHIAFNFTLIKLYGNSLMTSLNSRTLATYTREPSNSYAKELSVMGGRNADIADINKASRPAQLVVNVETHEMVNSDIAGAVVKGDPEWHSTTSSRRNSDTKEPIAI